MVYCAGKLIVYLKLFYKSNRPHFLWVYKRDNPLGMFGRTLEKLVNHEPRLVIYKLFKCSPNIPRVLSRQYTHRRCGLLLK